MHLQINIDSVKTNSILGWSLSWFSDSIHWYVKFSVNVVNENTTQSLLSNFKTQTESKTDEHGNIRADITQYHFPNFVCTKFSVVQFALEFVICYGFVPLHISQFKASHHKEQTFDMECHWVLSWVQYFSLFVYCHQWLLSPKHSFLFTVMRMIPNSLYVTVLVSWALFTLLRVGSQILVCVYIIINHFKTLHCDFMFPSQLLGPFHCLNLHK